ncbi:hypothetical protein AAHH67_15965 [Niallia circulans]
MSSIDKFYHKDFGDLSEKELTMYLDFLATVMFNMDSFDAWEAENIINDEYTDKCNEEMVARYNDLIREKTKLENKMYGNH